MVMLFGNGIYCYSQSADYTKYLNQITQKAKSIENEFKQEIQRNESLAKNSANKDMYVVYYNGQKLGNFPNEASCKAFTNKIKANLDSYMTGLLNRVPVEFRSAIRNDLNNYKNRFTYRRVSNPNYRPSGFSNKNNGFNPNNFQNYDSFIQQDSDDKTDAQDNSGQIKGSVFDTEVENPRDINIVTKNDLPEDSAPLAVENDFDKYKQGKSSVITIDDTNGKPYVDYRPSGVTLSEVSKLADTPSVKNDKNKEILNEIKGNMTDDQYYSLRAYWLSEMDKEPDFVANRNGAYIFKNNNTLYEVTPNKFFTSLVSVKKISTDGKMIDYLQNKNTENYDYSDEKEQLIKGETSLSVITKDGKVISLKENAEVTGGVKWEDESFKKSKKLGLEASGSREISYSSGVNVNIKDGKISLSTIEAHISGNVSIGATAGYNVKANEETSVSLVAGDFKYKKEKDGFSVDASAGLAAGATIKDNEKSVRAGGDFAVASIIGEIGYKEKDCTNLYANDPKAVVHFLKNEIKVSKEKLNKTSVPVTTTGFVMDKEKIKQDRENELTKIETYNKLIKKIETTGSTDGVIYYPTAD